MDGERLLPGDGIIDLHNFLSALKAIGYAGPVAPEVLGSTLGPLGLDEATRQTIVSVRAVMSDV